MTAVSTTAATTAPELLAPAGDWDAMRAAVANGADAVYFGVNDFNARHRAANFELDELAQVMLYLHDHNVRGYMTLNTLIFSDELEAIADVVRRAVEAKVDAVIVQDLGLVRLIHRLAPSLAVHGSTQMTLTEPKGVEFVRALGVERVILARELSLTDIRQVRDGTDVPVEVFVHGALCVSYSGQCLTSESLGGRSANRGQCAQACRLPYDLIVDGDARDLGDKAYLLSPKDLSAADLIGDLAEAGVVSLKIEGRLKSAHYVAATTQVYRAGIDALAQGEPFTPSEEQRIDLEQSFSRGFSHGFLSGVDHQELVHGLFPKSRGVRAGTVVGHDRQGLLVELEPSTQPLLKPGDGVVFDEGHPEQDEQGGRIVGIEPRGQRRVLVRFRHGDVQEHAVVVGSIVWRTDDPTIRRKLERSYARDEVVRREPIDAELTGEVGSALTLTLRDSSGHSAKATWPGPLQQARKHATTADLVREMVGRLGHTPYELRHVTLAGGTQAMPVMTPKSVLSDLKQQAVAELLSLRSRPRATDTADDRALEHLRESIAASRRPSVDQYSLNVLVRSLDHLQEVIRWRQSLPADDVAQGMIYCDFEDVRQYGPAVSIAHDAGMKIALATIRIIKPSEEGLLRQIASHQPDALLVRNLAAMMFYRRELPDTPLVADYSLNVANEITASIVREAGAVRMVPSYDLNWKQLTAMMRRCDAGTFEAVVHQHMPMFHMEHCVFAATLSNGKDFHDCGRPCEGHVVSLRDRMSVDHPLLADVGCRNTVYNGVAQSAAELIPRMRDLGIRHYRVELLRQPVAEVAPLLDQYRRILLGHDDGRAASRQLRVLNQLGVTRGTFDYE